MKLIIVLIAVILYTAMASGRNLHEYKTEDEDYDVDLEKHGRDHNSQPRHRRRSRQSYYSSYNPFYYDNRREEDLLSRILYQIEEISSYIKRSQQPPPPPPPQIIYIPIPYPVGQCTSKPNITFPTRFDKNQNWGLVVGDLGLESDDGGDGSRPINLDPVLTDEPTVKPPPVEHGSSQAGLATPAPPTLSNPGPCKAAILVCCQQTRREDRQQCFTQYGCRKTYSTASSCHPEVVKRVIQEFAESYAPINNT